MGIRCIKPANGPVSADFQAMPSKSATHRALVTAALASGVSTIQGPLDAADTRCTLEGLRRLGLRIDERDGAWIVHGSDGAIPGGGSIELGDSGTSARFLTALASLGAQPSMLDGSPRLRERPMEELLEALLALGAVIVTSPGRTFPMQVGGSKVRGGRTVLSGARSSQFASALLLAAPMFEQGLRLEVAPPRVSFSYVQLTIEILESFGGVVELEGNGAFSVVPQQLNATSLVIEGDHSSASYWLAAAAILGGRVRVRGLRAKSLQPDARFLRDLVSLGCRVESDGMDVIVEGSGRVPPFSWDLADAPDLAPTAAVLALFAEGPCTLTGLSHIALKESDRLAVLEDNLNRLGARAAVNEGALSVLPPPKSAAQGGTISVAGDHRIAMAFAIAGLSVGGVTIDEPDAVAKSYPRFWDDFAQLVRTGS